MSLDGLNQSMDAGEDVELFPVTKGQDDRWDEKKHLKIFSNKKAYWSYLIHYVQ